MLPLLGVLQVLAVPASQKCMSRRGAGVGLLEAWSKSRQEAVSKRRIFDPGMRVRLHFSSTSPDVATPFLLTEVSMLGCWVSTWKVNRPLGSVEYCTEWDAWRCAVTAVQLPTHGSLRASASRQLSYLCLDMQHGPAWLRR